MNYFCHLVCGWVTLKDAVRVACLGYNHYVWFVLLQCADIKVMHLCNGTLEVDRELHIKW